MRLGRIAVWMVTLAAIALAAAAAITLAAPPDRAFPATATAGPPPAHWLAKSFDLPGMATRADFQWVSCLGPEGLACQAGDIPTFADYNVFYRWAPAHPGAIVLYDPESWPATGHWQYTHMWTYIRKFEQRAHVYGIKVIAAPVRDRYSMPSVEVTAATYGAIAVDIQCQFFTSRPADYAAYIKAAAAGIRKANPATLVLGGIATDAGGHPVTVTQMVSSYKATRAYTDGYWLNAAIWPASRGGTGCATSGCRAIGAAFLTAIS